MCEVLSEAARDETPLKVENRLDVLLDVTCKSLSADMHYQQSKLGAEDGNSHNVLNAQYCDIKNMNEELFAQSKTHCSRMIIDFDMEMEMEMEMEACQLLKVLLS